MGVRIFLLVCLLHLIRSSESSDEVLDLSCDQIEAFVDGHNSRRLSLAQGNVTNQPTASNMKYMVWDEELADKASKYSLYGINRLLLLHNQDSTVESRRFAVGENLFMGPFAGGELDIDAVLNAWFDEHYDYTYGLMTYSVLHSLPQIGHYTQMAWAETVHIGCGVAKNWSGTYYVVCNYGPAGNMYDVTPYEEGDPMEELICSDDCSLPYGLSCQLDLIPIQ